MNNIDYDKLHSQLIKAVINNEGPEAVPEMKNVINAYLEQYDGRLDRSVYNVQNTANHDMASMNGLTRKQITAINNAGLNETKKLNDHIDKSLNQDKVNAFVESSINQHVAKITRRSTSQVGQYFSALTQEKKDVDKLATKTKILNARLNDKDKQMKDMDKKFWYGIATTVIVTACVVWLFL